MRHDRDEDPDVANAGLNDLAQVRQIWRRYHGRFDETDFGDPMVVGQLAFDMGYLLGLCLRLLQEDARGRADAMTDDRADDEDDTVLVVPAANDLRLQAAIMELITALQLHLVRGCLETLTLTPEASYAMDTVCAWLQRRKDPRWVALGGRNGEIENPLQAVSDFCTYMAKVSVH